MIESITHTNICTYAFIRSVKTNWNVMFLPRFHLFHLYIIIRLCFLLLIWSNERGKFRPFAHASTKCVLFTLQMRFIWLRTIESALECFMIWLEWSTHCWLWPFRFISEMSFFSFAFQRVHLFSFSSAYEARWIFKSNIITFWMLSRCVEIVNRKNIKRA